MAAKKKAATPRRKKAEPKSRGLGAADVVSGSPPAKLEQVEARIEAGGGAVIGRYRDPIGGHWQVIASLPIDQVQPTPFQRDLSEAHAKRLTDVIGKLDRFLDPIVAVKAGGDATGWWTPNGGHRLAAVKALGGRSIVALVVPDEEVAHRILALNTEKAHQLREKALEVARLARMLAGMDDRPESAFALEFEEPALLTLGLCYEERGRFSGGAYHSVLKRCDRFLDVPLAKAASVRTKRAERLLALDDAVVAVVDALKARGFQSPYLKAFVVARINPLRWVKDAAAEFDATIDKMMAGAEKFDVAKVKADQLAATGGAPEE